MEFKKQLIIVPPMSQPLQKLHEVLQGIAESENIEISIIDDMREINQFLGTAGQCLMVYSNAKKCASFLQEQRFLLAKSHSKVILLTPKEIPAKTLIKFTKIGLTESILENSPPKTLLYKVKLLLRSIKTSNTSLDEKDQVVKNMIESNQPTSAKEEVSIDRVMNEETIADPAIEEKSKIRAEQEENIIDYGANLKGKKSTQEELIQTHWKSKLKKEEELPSSEDDEVSKIEADSSIDTYYRGMKKNSSIDVLDADTASLKKRLESSSETDDFGQKKKSTSIEIDLFDEKKDRTNKLRDEDDDSSYKKKNKGLLLEEPESEEDPKDREYAQEDSEEKRRKDLLELEALFEEAKKRQKAGEAQDLGGHYKGKINNSKLDFEEDEDFEEKKEYDNSGLVDHSKPTTLDILAGEEDLRRRYEEEEQEERDPRSASRETIDNNLSSDRKSADKIDTLMKGKESNDGPSKFNTTEKIDREITRDDDEDNDTADSRSQIQLEDSAEEDKQRNVYDKKNEEPRNKASVDLNLESPLDEETDSKSNRDAEKEIEYAKKSDLKLQSEENDSKKGGIEDQDESMSARKNNKLDFGPPKNKEAPRPNGKVDKIDTYYRSGSGSKKDHDWNLASPDRGTDIALEKAPKKDDENILHGLEKDAGEQTIDYRKLKEEFQALAEGASPIDSNAPYGARGSGPSEALEDGSFKVVEVDATAFIFGVNVINLLYQKESKKGDFFKMIAEEMLSSYKAIPVFYGFKISDKKHQELFNSFSLSHPLVSDDLRAWWDTHKKDEALFSDYFQKTMTTWICREMSNKSNGQNHWEDVELPSWASNELTDKKVELVFPYFDGVDRMGVALVFFPLGLNPKLERSIEMTLEMARTVLLDEIQRKIASLEVAKSESDPLNNGKKNVLSNIFGMFKGKKAG